MTSSVLIWGTLAALLAGPLLVWIRRQPVRGLYLAFFCTAILATPNLPLVREKFAAPEVMMLMTWIAMALNPRPAHAPLAPITSQQRAAITLGGFLVVWILISFLVNTLRYPHGFGPSLVETINYLYGWLMFVTVIRLVDDFGKWRGCLIAWVLGAAVVSLVGVAALGGAAPGWAYDEFTGRISSTLKFENQVPSFLLPIFPALVLMVVTRTLPVRMRLLLALLALATTATVVGTGSRTALAMLIVCVLGSLFIAARQARYRVLSTGLTAVLAFSLVAGMALFIAYVYMSQQGDYRLGTTPAWQRGVLMLGEWLEGKRALDETRPSQIRMMFDQLPDYIVFGTGPKLFTVRFAIDEIHNTYAGVLIELGLLGFLLFMIWLVYVTAVSWQSALACARPDYRLVALALIVGFAALGVYGMFIFGLRQRNLWLLAGLMIALSRLNLVAALQERSAAPDLTKERHGNRRRRLTRPRPTAQRPVRRKLPAGRTRSAADPSFSS